MHPYLASLLGGVLIGLSATIMLGGLGKIAGISGIFMGVFNREDGDRHWRTAFIAGLLFGGVLLLQLAPAYFNYELSGFSWTSAITAGLLVGFGTRLGSGCTSGHGVCGLSRLSKRSFVATLTFILAGIITVAVKGVLS